MKKVMRRSLRAIISKDSTWGSHLRLSPVAGWKDLMAKDVRDRPNAVSEMGSHGRGTGLVAF
ncbi:hypothetical protein J3L12_10225, partial [Meiothermus sp. CFH 77666]|nr:hypothetical protein [Meiothermus sp. CFH 77666]